MNYTYIDTMGNTHRIKLTNKSSSWAWVNYDLPTLEAVDGSGCISSDINGIHISADDDDTYNKLVNFLIRSDKAFQTKFRNKSWVHEMTGIQDTLVKMGLTKPYLK